MSGKDLIFCLLWARVGLCEAERLMFGEVSSPLYPQPYPAGIMQHWELQVPDGHQIQLTINHLDIEPSPNCSNKFLMIVIDKKVLWTFCGQNSTDRFYPGDQPILAPGSHLQLIFVSDHSNTTSHTGFTASYKAIAVDCGVPELTELMELSENNPLTTYMKQISIKCKSEFYQLDKNGTFTCNAESNWVSEIGEKFTENVPKCKPVCGMNIEDMSGGRVFGGKPLRRGELPWQLLHRSNPRSGASLISDYWALTAAHVVDGYENGNMTWRGGIINVLDNNPVFMETEKIIIHPDYKKVGKEGHQTDFNNDIALIKMSARVPLGPNIRPVCLPSKTDKAMMKGMMGTVSGFGVFNWTVSNLLRYGHVHGYSLESCVSDGFPVSDNMFCAGNDAGGVDSCRGDSGGPLFVPMLGDGTEEQPYVVRGIQSWGPKCARRIGKGYYTKVQNYLDWIKETITNN